jgi:MinD superfamily P-loop ATPase
MQDVVVLSGKGGTGKTTVVGALARLCESTILVDCDVDASNLHLITRPEIKEEHSFMASHTATIDPAHCIACDICLDFCRFNAIYRLPEHPAEGDEGYRIDRLSCEGCALCKHICPADAISMQTSETGKWYVSDTPFGPLVHGRLGPAQGNSGRLVTLLRNKAKELFESVGFELTLIDGPPGIGCPTIASLTGSDYALVVTEPSLSAFHDLRRVIELIHHFRIPAGVCVNKADVNSGLSDEIDDYCREVKADILGHISYSITAIQAQMDWAFSTEFGERLWAAEMLQVKTKLMERLERIRSTRVSQCG